MYSLIVDTAKEDGFLLIAKENIVLSYMDLPKGSSLSKEIFPLIQRLLKEEYPEVLKHLSFIACSRGPGSFTATRVGISIAQTLCYALNIPLITFTTPELLLPKFEGPFTYVQLLKSGKYFVIKGKQYPTYLNNMRSFILENSNELNSSLEAPIISKENFLNPLLPEEKINPEFALSYLNYLFKNKKFTELSHISLVYTSQLN